MSDMGADAIRAAWRRAVPPIEVCPGFLTAVFLPFCVGGLSLALPFLLAAAVHEAGHLLALRLLRIPVKQIELRASGAVIRSELCGAPREAWAAAAGPAANLLLAGLFYRLWPMLSFCGAMLCCYNLLPVSSLDGGLICRLLLPVLFGRFGLILCKLLHWGTAAAVLAAGVYGTCVLHLGLLPAALAGLFLVRLPNLLDKAAINC